jgi:hypothetical protein
LLALTRKIPHRNCNALPEGMANVGAKGEVLVGLLKANPYGHAEGAGATTRGLLAARSLFLGSSFVW